jgi:5-methylcytosine-specific restriction enzyme subunit McrC
MGIPIENIYYLLCYSWNKLDEKDRVRVSIDGKTELLDLFAKILVNATRILLKRGVDKAYVAYTDELIGVKGKIDIAQTLKHNLLHKQRTICTYDNFSTDIITNRILVATMNRLIRTKNLDHTLKKELIGLNRMLPDISLIETTMDLFKEVKLHRNNRFYDFVINVCQIIFENTFPSEEKGKYVFYDFTRDEKKMSRLFEAFVRNFYRIEQRRYDIVKSERINWRFDSIGIEDSAYLPGMMTDITLENDREKIIIDTKYYQETMTVNYDKTRIKSENLYQLFSYLLNQRNNY